MLAFLRVTTAPMTLLDKAARTRKEKVCCKDLDTLFAESNNLPTIKVEFLAVGVFRKYINEGSLCRL